VLVPGLTDEPANIEKVAEFVAPMKNVEWVEVLPLHQMGAFKWQALGLDYSLDGTPTPTAEQVRTAQEIFRAAGCHAR
jgi:pyruvate formate lyase activating enzyme